MAKTKKLKPQSHGYEFGGPLGAAAITFGLPVACYAAAFVCNDVTGCPAPSLLYPRSFSLDALKAEVNWPGFSGLLNAKALTWTLAYYLSSFVLYAFLPAKEVDGVELRSGGRLKYRFNAFHTAIVTLAVALGGTLAKGSEFALWTFIWNNYISLLTANILVAYCLATYVYVRSFSVRPTIAPTPVKRELAEGGHSGNILYDWFIGRELNPPVHIPFISSSAAPIDIKSFMELRPGMLGWIMLDLAFAARQHHNYGKVTDSMMLVLFSQSLYVFDALWNEPAILTTMDITTDGFGFMLAFGDLVWVPFTYSLQARYLAMHPVELGITGVGGIIAVQALGYYIFRAANNQKNRFRTNPTDPRVAHLEAITTASGSKLLVSGWWGSARHINYLGDWIMSWAYCLPTGIAGYLVRPSVSYGDFGSAVIPNESGSLLEGRQVVQGEARGWGMIITYFFMVYFAVLLIHRERRDEEKCRKKYGKDWDEYCRRVKWRILPGIY